MSLMQVFVLSVELAFREGVTETTSPIVLEKQQGDSDVWD